MMWSQWKIFEKMTEDLNYDLFWGPKWPGNWASEANIQHTSKSSSNWHEHQDWWATNGKFVKKWPKTGIFYLFGCPKWPKNLASEAHILHAHKSACNEPVKQYWCETSEIFLRMWPNTRILTYFGAQNDPEIGPLRPIFYISESISNEHIQQDWCESRGNSLTKYSKTWILTHLEAQQFGPLGLSFTHLQK